MKTMIPYFKMYLGNPNGFHPSREIIYKSKGEFKRKQTSPTIITKNENGDTVHVPTLLVAEFSKEILQGRKTSEAREDLMAFFQNFFLTQTNGLKLQDFFVTVPNPLDGREKVFLKYRFEDIVETTPENDLDI